jgi:uncharacterized protein
LAERSLCRHTPEVGAVCGKAARTVLCGGRAVTRVPTATRAMSPIGTSRLLPNRPYRSVGVYNFAVGRSDLPEDLAYNLVKAVYDNQPRLVSSTDSAKETIPQNILKDTFLPFHPGAVRYYREIGITIPDALAVTN